MGSGTQVPGLPTLGSLERFDHRVDDRGAVLEHTFVQVALA